MRQVRRRHGPGQQIALQMIAADFRQDTPLACGFYALGHDRHPQKMPDLDDGAEKLRLLV